MASNRLLIGALAGAGLLASGVLVAGFLVVRPQAVKTDPPPSVPKPAPVAAAKPVPAKAAPRPPRANPDAALYETELEWIQAMHKILMDSANKQLDIGSNAAAQETLTEAKRLPSGPCLIAERDRGTPFYPALATCKAVNAGL